MNQNVDDFPWGETPVAESDKKAARNVRGLRSILFRAMLGGIVGGVTGGLLSFLVDRKALANATEKFDGQIINELVLLGMDRLVLKGILLGIIIGTLAWTLYGIMMWGFFPYRNREKPAELSGNEPSSETIEHAS